MLKENNKKALPVDAYVHQIRYERKMTESGEKIVRTVTELTHGNSAADHKALKKAYRDAIESLMHKDGFPKRLIQCVVADPMAMATPEISGSHSGTDFEGKDGKIHVISTDSVRIGRCSNKVWSEIVFCHQIY